MGLFDFLKKPQATKTEKLENGELPFGWVRRNADFITPMDKKLTDLSIQIHKTKDKTTKKKLIEELIAFFYSYQEECQSKGECFVKYFDDMWMHCHNSQKDDFPFIEPLQEELKNLK